MISGTNVVFSGDAAGVGGVWRRSSAPAPPPARVHLAPKTSATTTAASATRTPSEGAPTGAAGDEQRGASSCGAAHLHTPGHAHLCCRQGAGAARGATTSTTAPGTASPSFESLLLELTPEEQRTVRVFRVSDQLAELSAAVAPLQRSGPGSSREEPSMCPAPCVAWEPTACSVRASLP